MRRLFLAAPVMIAVILPAASSAGTCSGNACASLRFDGSACALVNVGERAVKGAVNFKVSVSGTIPFTLAPGEKRSAQGFLGCMKGADITSYTVDLVDGQPGGPVQTGEGIARRMGFGPPAACTGRLCRDVTLSVKDNCVWVTNNGTSVAKVDLRLDSGTVHVEVPGRREASPGTVSSGNAAASVAAAECVQARASLKLLTEAGISPSLAPEIAGTVNRCDIADKAAAAGRAPATSQPTASPDIASVTAYDSFSQKTYQTFQVRARTAAGCVADAGDIAAYTAN
jgi:hypothetical protein